MDRLPHPPDDPIETRDLKPSTAAASNRADPPRDEAGSKDPIDSRQLTEGLSALGFLRRLELAEEIGSTHRTLVTRVRERKTGPGLLLLAERQTEGRGRLGRTWISIPYRALTFSFTLPNLIPRNPGWITVAFAVAAATAVESETGVSLKIKWPNDLYLEGRKAGGVLAQALGTEESALVVVSMGLNVNAAPKSAGDDRGNHPACLAEGAGRALDRTRLLTGILEATDGVFKMLASGRKEPVLEGLRRRSLLIGRRAVFTWNRRTFEGRIKDHTDRLGILLETTGGEVELPGESAELMSYHAP